MAPPILLAGFDFDMQKKVVFDKIWGAAFLHPKFTNDRHPSLQGLDPLTMREVKYGNNVAMLFRAVLHLGEACGQPKGEYFWPAIAKAFSTQPRRVTHMVDTLTEARRTRRSRAAKEISETARAADRWIEFIDRCHFNDVTIPSPHEMDGILRAFLEGFKGTQVNASNVPLDRARPPPMFNDWRRSSPEPRSNPPPQIKTEFSPTSRIPSGPSTSRKRSTTPPTVAQDPSYRPASAKRARHHDADRSSLTSPRSEIPQTGATSTPEAWNFVDRVHSFVTVATTAPIHTANAQQQHSPAQPELRLNTYMDTDVETRGFKKSNSVDQQANEGQEDTAVGTTTAKPTETEDKLSPTDDTTDPSKQLLDEVNALVKVDGQMDKPPAQEKALDRALVDQVNSMTSVMESMMESMHAVADNLQSIKDDLADVKKTQTSPPSSVEPVEELTKTVMLLKDEVASLKNQPRHATVDHHVRALVADQNKTINLIAAELTGQHPRIRLVAAHRQAPKNLGEALKAAEVDLLYHLQTIRGLYLQCNQRANRQVSEQTADLIMALEAGIQATRGGSET